MTGCSRQDVEEWREAAEAGLAVEVAMREADADVAQLVTETSDKLAGNTCHWCIIVTLLTHCG